MEQRILSFLVVIISKLSIFIKLTFITLLNNYCKQNLFLNRIIFIYFKARLLVLLLAKLNLHQGHFSDC